MKKITLTIRTGHAEQLAPGLNLAKDPDMIIIALFKGGKFLIYEGQEHFIHDLEPL